MARIVFQFLEVGDIRLQGSGYCAQQSLRIFEPAYCIGVNLRALACRSPPWLSGQPMNLVCENGWIQSRVRGAARRRPCHFSETGKILLRPSFLGLRQIRCYRDASEKKYFKLDMQLDTRQAKTIARNLRRDKVYRSSVPIHTIVVAGQERQVVLYGLLEELKQILHKVSDDEKKNLHFWCKHAIQQCLNNAKTLEDLLELIPEMCDMSHGEFISTAKRNIRNYTDRRVEEMREQLTARMRQVREYLRDKLELVEGLIGGFYQDFSAFARLDELKMRFGLLRSDNHHSALLMRPLSSTTLSIFVETGDKVTYDVTKNSFVNYPESLTELPVARLYRAVGS